MEFDLMPEKYVHTVEEKRKQDEWKAHNLHAFSPSSSKPVYSIDTPPPTVSGMLHIGHVFSYTHIDIIARYKRVSGHEVYYPAGYDNNGLATERFVEKERGIKGSEMARDQFIQECLKTSEQMEKRFLSLWGQLGFSYDLSLSYSTISPQVRKLTQTSFLHLLSTGKIYRAADATAYCVGCTTALAQTDLESKEKQASFVTISFDLAGEDKKVSIATTRPELLPAVGAIFYHPSDERYIHLRGKQAVVPLFGQKVPFLPDELVKPDKGTGLVMCATFGDQTDILWYKKHKLSYKAIVGKDGLWSNQAGPLAGLHVFAARKKVISLLEEEGRIEEIKSISHHVLVHERCKQEIEYLVLPQWFVSLLEYKEELLEAAEQIIWHPPFMKARYKDWVEHLSWDWCISRQRFYGIPFPVWHCTACSAIIPASEQQLPLDPQTTPPPSCPTCSATTVIPDMDVMDTWFTSASTPHIHTGLDGKSGKISLPMSLRPQAHDIIRTWAFYTIAKTYLCNQKSLPWNCIAISGHVLAGKEKISKSQGNSMVDPEQLLSKFSADAVRYWACHGRLGTDTAFSEHQIALGQRTITKLWNAFGFITEFLQKNSQTEKEKNVALNGIDKWLLTCFSHALKAYHKAYEEYDYTTALEVTEKFFWHSLCDTYLEYIKDMAWHPEKYTPEQLHSTTHTLEQVGLGILQMYAPVCPFITDVLYEKWWKEKTSLLSIHQTTFVSVSTPQSRLSEQMESVLSVVEKVRKIKTTYSLSLKEPVKTLTVVATCPHMQEVLAQEEKFLKAVTCTDNLIVINTAQEENHLKDEKGLHITLITTT